MNMKKKPPFRLCRCMLIMLTGWTFAHAQSGTVRINEFMAANKTTNILDNYGRASDWIELYNTNALPVNLDGWFLTDSVLNLNRWPFPAVTLVTRAEARTVRLPGGR